MLRRLTRLLPAAAAAILLGSGLAAGRDANSRTASRTRGIDVEGMDRSVRPGDDFNAYANGGWIHTTEIPPDRSHFSVGAILDEEVNRRTAELIQAAGSSSPGSEARKVGDYYAAWMDEAAIERRGLSPLHVELADIDRISDRAGLARVLGSQLRADVDALNNTNFHTSRVFGLWVAPDFSHPDVNVGYLFQGGLGMPDRDFYLGTAARDVELQGKYKAHIAAVLKLAGIAEADAKAAGIYDLERAIAAVHVSRTDSEDVKKANNPWPVSEFGKRAPGLDWEAFLNAAGLSRQPMIMVWQPSAVAGIAALAGSRPLSDWKDYLKFRVIDRASGLLPKAFADERFGFYGTALTGVKQPRDRWKRAVDATSDGLGDAVGKMYVEKYFPPRAKTEAQEMVRNIVAAFEKRIDRLEWMSPATRKKAKAKLATLYVGVGYPEHWQDYSGLVVDGDALENAKRAGMLLYRQSLEKLKKPVDKSEWCMTPQTVNAVNLPLQNALNFPAAILNPPFFDMDAEPVFNYGAIGSVIGHEISHSFDDQGAQFDPSGRLANWWTKEDFEHFEKAGQRLAAEYDAYEPLPGLHVNGKLTLSENIADVAGIAAAFDGYRAAYGGKAAPEKDGFTGDQRFFLAFAQAWRGKSRPEALRMQLLTDGHSPGEYRADTVRNLDAWYDAFDVKPGEKLYLKPAERVRVW